MNESTGPMVPFLFNGIFLVILINFLVNICLFYFSKIKNIKIVCWYWASLFLTYVLQGQFQEGHLPITMGFSATMLPVCIMAEILFSSIQKKLPWKRYLFLYTAAVLFSCALSQVNSEFTTIAFPVCLAICVPLVEAAFYVLASNRRSTTVLQKFMSLQYLISAIHVMNFAFLRMIPGTQVFGFGTALILYQIMSITLFAFAFEEYSKGDKERLQVLVNDRTKELTEANEKLQNALRMKETLFKVVVHDIANPVQAQMMAQARLERSPASLPEILPKLTKLNQMISNIIKQVRSIELLNTGRMNLALTQVNLEECINDVNLVFEEQLKAKDIRITFENGLSPDTFIKADGVAFTNSVMSNLISNAIKFSETGSSLKVRSYERGPKVVIEIEDQGIGMPQELTFDLFNPLKKTTRLGTGGETGSGYGLPLVKSYLDHFGGDIDVESRSIELHPANHGTKFTLTMEKSSSLQ